MKVHDVGPSRRSRQQAHYELPPERAARCGLHMNQWRIEFRSSTATRTQAFKAVVIFNHALPARCEAT